MVGIAAVLQFLYPTAQSLVDYVVTHADGADHLTLWKTASLGAQPDEASLATTQASPAYLDYVSPAGIATRHADADALAMKAELSKDTALARLVAALHADLNALRAELGKPPTDFTAIQAAAVASVMPGKP